MVVWLYAAAIPALAQSTAAVSSSTCPPCSLELTRLRVLATNGTLDAVVSSPQGRIYLTSVETRDVIEVFNGESTGTIGRGGGGPGEFETIFALAVAGDELHVFDVDNGRRSVFDFDHELLWTALFPYTVYSAIVFDAGATVINAPITSPDRVGKPYHVVDSAGRIVRSFGGGSEIYRYDRMFSGRREIARAHNGTFWAAHKTKYVLEHWDTLGARLETVRREAAWFPPVEHWRFPESGGPAPSLVMDIAVDRQGRILVLSVISDEDWRSAVRLSTGAHGGRLIPDKSRLDDYWDTVVEVFNASGDRLLATRRLDEYATQLINAELLAGPIQSADGLPGARLWKVNFRSQ